MHTSIAHDLSAPPSPTYVPPLDIAREQARQVLVEANALPLEITDSIVLARHFGGLCESLRQVLAALDAEDGRHA